jgi:hypothetical protein
MAVMSKAAFQPRAEEHEHERDKGRKQESGDLVLASVVLPPREALVEPCLTVRNAVRQGEAGSEQQPSKHSGER